jgi:type IV secretory pathway VirB3-like protein
MFSWDFSARKDHPVSWYIIGIIVVLSLVLYGIVEGLYLLSIVAFLFAGVYILMENNSHPVVHVSIDESGVQVGGSFYEMKGIETFSIIRSGNIPLYLRIRPRKKLSPVVDIPLTQDVNPNTLREWLSGYVTEDKDATLSNSDVLIYAMRL